MIESTASVSHFTGVSCTGKTTLIEALIPRFRARDLRVGTVKHTHHSPDLDLKGKDSWRHGKAGADRVLLLGPGGASFFVHRQVDQELDAWRALFEGSIDILLVEGFKRTALDCIELKIDDVAETRVQRDDTEEHRRWILTRPRTDDRTPEALIQQLVSEFLD